MQISHWVTIVKFLLNHWIWSKINLWLAHCLGDMYIGSTTIKKVKEWCKQNSGKWLSLGTLKEGQVQKGSQSRSSRRSVQF